LVLVVAPDHHDLRAEVVEDLPGVPEVAEEALAMPGRACRAAVVPVLAAHRLGPVARIPVALRQAGVLKDAAEDARHVLVEAGERRVMRHAQAENLAHERSSTGLPAVSQG